MIDPFLFLTELVLMVLWKKFTLKPQLAQISWEICIANRKTKLGFPRRSLSFWISSVRFTPGWCICSCLILEAKQLWKPLGNLLQYKNKLRYHNLPVGEHQDAWTSLCNTLFVPLLLRTWDISKNLWRTELQFFMKAKQTAFFWCQVQQISYTAKLH